MAFLSSCWIIIENVLIPPGLDKWYRLRLFIHPLLLLYCRFFIFAKLIGSWLSNLLHPFRIVWHAILSVFRLIRNWISCLFPVVGFDEISVSISNVYEDLASKICEVVAEDNTIQSITRVLPITDGSITILEDHEEEIEEEEDDDNEEESIVRVDQDQHRDDSSLLSNFTLPILEKKERSERGVGELDLFYMKYEETMWWFDQLNCERRCAVSAILNKELGISSLSESIEPMDFSLAGVASKNILRSLESDFEVVYVGQACLGWEALHHHFRKVEALTFTDNDHRGDFYGNVAGKFQQFQVLLERFIENERRGGKRFWNYAQSRFSLRNLLQVPEVSGYAEEIRKGFKVEAIKSREVLDAIEKAITAFWIFLKTDNKKSSGKLRRLLWFDSPVEDPRDLELLTNLSKEVHKKKIGLKDLQKKIRWSTKANLLEEPQRIEVLFSEIETMLVSRVLQMSVISTPQLKWCQQKLNSIELKQGRVIRTSSDNLFPHS